MKLFDLTGKVALVTGGNGGIGLAMAQGMASCGASIVIAGRDAEKASAALG
jgi:2-deoxy-D-gluconate 3-dehydrogenase